MSATNSIIVPSPRASLYSPDNVFRLRRNLTDCLVSIPSGSTPTNQYVPGFSGTGWVILGSTLTDVSPDGSVGYYAQPFSLQFTLDALIAYADIQSMFSEFRVAAVKYTMKTLNGSAGLQNVGGIVPEIWASAWPDDAQPPSSIAVQQQRVNTKKCLTGNNALVMTVAPRPAVQLYQSAVASGYAYMSNTDTWVSTGNAASTPHYAISGLIRNFVSIAASGFNVRFEAEAFLEFRRPR